MSGVLALLLRFVVIVFGYAMAALFASGFLHLVTLPMLGLTAEEARFVATGSIVFSVPFIALFVGYFAFLPTVVGILIGEVLGQRDWLYYAIAGGVIGAIVIGFFRDTARSGHALAGEPAFVFAFVGAGICGGLGYWLVAGRGTGGWRRRTEITSTAP